VDADLAAEVAQTWCKLHKGAEASCAAEGATAKADAHAATFEVWVDRTEEKLGIYTVDARVELSVDGTAHPALTTPLRAYGGSRDEAVKRGLHEWAVVYGAALVDWTLASPERAALAALDKEHGATPRAVSGKEVYRGYTLVRGTEGRVDHAALLGVIGEDLSALGPGVHGLSVEILQEAGNATRTCTLDGESSGPLCRSAARYAWPGGAGTQIRQYWVVE